MTCKHQTLHAHVRKSTHKHSFLKQITFPLKDASENICAGTSGNGRKFGISQCDMQWVFFKHFRGMIGALSSATSKPVQNLWSPAASGSHYPCHLPNKWPYWAHSWSPGMIPVFCIITFICCFHNMPTTLFQLLLTKHMAWCDLMKVAKEDF